MTTVTRRLCTATAVAAAAGLILSGCVSNYATSDAIDVAVTDTTCRPSQPTATSGTVQFTIANTGSDVNEFEILAADKLRIVAEKENVTPGTTVSLAVSMQPGTYYTACRFRQIGAPIGLAKFTVTGATQSTTTSDSAALTTAVEQYTGYVRSQVAELVPNTQSFVAAFIAGDQAKARSLYPVARVSYERIEPTAEQFGDLDPKIDYRKPGADAEGLVWTGFHRIEADLWPEAAAANYPDGSIKRLDAAGRNTVGKQLVTDIERLAAKVNAPTFKLTVSEITNGAVSLLDEVAAPDGKLPGEEDEFSHTDLWDFLANVEGAEVAYGSVRDVAAAKDPALVKQLDARFASMKRLLSTYGSFAKGFVSYDTVAQPERNALGAQLNALSEPLSRLTHTVLGIQSES